MQEDGSQSILATSLATGSVGALTSGPQIDADPAFSPAGMRLAFTSDRDGDEEIYVSSWDGTGVAQVTFNDVFDAEPTWSPDGTQIAYRSGPDGNAAIYIKNLIDGSTRLLTGGGATDKSPAFSPTGDRIAFVSDAGGDDDIYMIAADGTALKNLTKSPGDDIDPAWSPDGRKIAFASNRSGQLDLYTMRFDGKNQENQTQSEATEVEPAFSPDGARIAFTGSSGDGETDIFALSIDGDLGIDEITTRLGQESGPAWQPLDYARPRLRIVSPRLGRRASKRAGRSRAKSFAVKLRRVSGRVEKAGASAVDRVEVAIRLSYRGRCLELNPAKRRGRAITRCGREPRFFSARGGSRFTFAVPRRHRKALSALVRQAARTSKKAARLGVRCEILARAVDTAGNIETRFERGRNRLRLRCR